MEPQEFFERRIIELGERIEALERSVESLSARTKHPVENLLWQLGFPVLSHGGDAQLLFSPEIHNSSLIRFYRMLRRYSFRLFLRDLIKTPEANGFDPLTRYCSRRAVGAYMETLAQLGIVILAGESYRLIRKVPSFGRTLEWYVCEILRREFLAPALFNVKLENTRLGGDYDVIAQVAGRLVYIEVKSSPPRGVEREAVEAFLARVRELSPSVALLLVDTELRMSDKLVPLLTAGLEREGKTEPQWAVERVANEIFHVRHCLYVTNSRKGIYSNLRNCFRDYLLHEGA